MQEATPIAPEQTTESVKEDVQWAKTRAQSGRTDRADPRAPVIPIEALGHKTDVPCRAAPRRRFPAARARSSQRWGAPPDSGDVKQGTRQAVGIAQENPIGLAIGAAAIGFVAGLLIPSTRVEDEKLGPVADQVKDKARETGQEAVQRGKEVAQQAAQAAQDAGREQAEGPATARRTRLRTSASRPARQLRQRRGRPSAAAPSHPGVGVREAGRRRGRLIEVLPADRRRRPRSPS